MSRFDDEAKAALLSLKNSQWDYPVRPNEQRVSSYDANDNPLQIDFYQSNKLVFSWIMTYDGSGRLLTKKIV